MTAGAVAGALTGLVVALCHAALLGWPPVPPPSLDPWVPWYAVVATLGALVEAALVWSKAPSGEQAPARPSRRAAGSSPRRCGCAWRRACRRSRSWGGS